MKRFWRHGQRMYGITPYTVTESALSSISNISGRTKAHKHLAARLRRTLARMQEHFADSTIAMPNRGATFDQFICAGSSTSL